MPQSRDLDRILRSTGVAAFATDGDCRVVACNDAALSALGLAPAEIMNRTCYDILDGHDLDGIRFCVRGCPVRRAAGAGRPIDNLTLRVRRGPHQSGLAEISTMVLSSGDGRVFVHMLRLAGAGVAPDHGGRTQAASGIRLTLRETEVLARIAAGASVKQLAPELSMSLTTARTHVRSILRKLGVHRQIDAVFAAQARGLL